MSVNYKILQKKRQEKEMLQKEVAEKLNPKVDARTISEIERGNVKITLDRAEQLAEILDFSILDFFY